MNPEFSKTFYEAFSAAQFKHYKQAIDLYNKELEETPDNFVAWCNRGISKLELGIEEKNAGLIEDSKADFRKAIELANAADGNGFSIAENNLKIAEETTFP